MRRWLLAPLLMGTCILVGGIGGASPAARKPVDSWTSVYAKFSAACVKNDEKAIKAFLKPSFQMYYKHKTYAGGEKDWSDLRLILKQVADQTHASTFDERRNPFNHGDGAVDYVIDVKRSPAATDVLYVDTWTLEATGEYRLQIRNFKD
jgi:hypothetical protein